MTLLTENGDCNTKGRHTKKRSKSRKKSKHKDLDLSQPQEDIFPGTDHYQASSRHHKVPHDAIGGELRQECAESFSLMQAIHRGVKELQHRFPEAKVEAVLERDHEDPSRSYPLIIVRDKIESVEQWQEMKTITQETIRSIEDDDMIIYTDVLRSQ